MHLVQDSALDLDMKPIIDIQLNLFNIQYYAIYTRKNQISTIINQS